MFTGASGHEYDMLLKRYFKVSRHQIYQTNLFKYHIEGDADPNDEQIAEGLSTLIPELTALSGRFVITLGALASRALIPEHYINMEYCNGIMYWSKLLKKFVTPIYHPAAGLYDAKFANMVHRGFEMFKYKYDNGVVAREWKEDVSHVTYIVAETESDVINELDTVTSHIAVDTEYRPDTLETWSVQVSTAPYRSLVIRTDRPDLIDVYRQWMIEHKPVVIYHNALADMPQLDRLGIPTYDFEDTMIMANALGDEPRKLKVLAYRIAHMKLDEYEDVVAPADDRIVAEYLREVADREWSDPEPELVYRKGEPHIKQGQNIGTKVRKILKKYDDGNKTGLREYWKGIVEPQVTDALGELPDVFLSDVEPKTAHRYACLSGDTQILTALGTWIPIKHVVNNKSILNVLTVNSSGTLTSKRITGWYRNRSKDRVKWMSFDSEMSTASARWGVSGNRFTPDHRIMTTRGWTEVQHLKVDDEIILPHKKFTEVQESVIVGCILGDGTFYRKHKTGNYTFTFRHSEKQVEYLVYKLKHFDVNEHTEIKRTNCTGVTTINGRKVKRSVMCYSNLVHSPAVTSLYKRIIDRENIWNNQDLIDWRSLAIWYQDDGTLVNNRQPRIYVSSYTEALAAKAAAVLESKFGLVVRIYKTSTGLAIDMHKYYSEIFFDGICRYVHKSMAYKLPTYYRQYSTSYADTIDEESRVPVTDTVTRVYENPISGGRSGSLKTSYCIDVEDTACFFTASGLVHNCMDSDATFRIYQYLKQRVEEEGVSRIVEIDTRASIPISRMMQIGVRIDQEYLNRLTDKFTLDKEQYDYDLAQTAQRHINVKSTLDVKELMAAIGYPVESTGADVLNPIAKQSDVVSWIMEARKLRDLVTKYTIPLPKQADKNSRIHTSYSLIRADTGRLSSSSPNLQNVSSRTLEGQMVRRAFIPTDGCIFGVFDYSQQELRMLAHLSGDKKLIGIYSEGRDLHLETAASIWGIEPENVEKWQRKIAKSVSFGVVYLISANGLYEDIITKPGIDPNEWSVGRCQQLLDGWNDTYPQARDWMKRVEDELKLLGASYCPFGKRRLLRNGFSPNKHVYQRAVRQAVNHPIQGGCASMVKIVMYEVDKYCQSVERNTKLICRPVLQIHDKQNCCV